MHGNIGEWVHDTYTVLSSDAQTDPVYSSGSMHTVRGGAWNLLYKTSVLQAKQSTTWDIETSSLDFVSPVLTTPTNQLHLSIHIAI